MSNTNTIDSDDNIVNLYSNNPIRDSVISSNTNNEFLDNYNSLSDSSRDISLHIEEEDDESELDARSNFITKSESPSKAQYKDNEYSTSGSDMDNDEMNDFDVPDLDEESEDEPEHIVDDNGQVIEEIPQKKRVVSTYSEVGSTWNAFPSHEGNDNKQKKFYWTIEWNLSKNIDPDHEKTTIIVDRCYEDMKIMDLIRYKWPKQEFKNAFNLEHIEDKENVNWLNSELKEKVLKQFLDHDKIHIFIKKFPNKMNNILDTRDAIKVQNVDSTVLSELLASKTCVEFPSLFVQIDDYKYVEEDTEEPVDKSIIDTNGKSIQFGNMVLKVYETAEDIENRDNQVIMEKQRLEEEMIQKQKEEEEQIKAKKLEEQNQLKQKRTFSLQEYKGIKKQKLTVSKAQNIPDFHENESEDSDDVTSEEEDEPKQNPSASNSLAARLFG